MNVQRGKMTQTVCLWGPLALFGVKVLNGSKPVNSPSKYSYSWQRLCGIQMLDKFILEIDLHYCIIMINYQL